MADKVSLRVAMMAVLDKIQLLKISVCRGNAADQSKFGVATSPGLGTPDQGIGGYSNHMAAPL